MASTGSHRPSPTTPAPPLPPSTALSVLPRRLAARSFPFPPGCPPSIPVFFSLASHPPSSTGFFVLHSFSSPRLFLFISFLFFLSLSTTSTLFKHQPVIPHSFRYHHFILLGFSVHRYSINTTPRRGLYILDYNCSNIITTLDISFLHPFSSAVDASHSLLVIIQLFTLLRYTIGAAALSTIPRTTPPR